MPFYEYECSSCGSHQEVLQKISDAPLKKCPKCGKSTLRKLISAPVFRLKGSGWYETDFKSDKENKRNLAGPDKEEPKGEAKTDTKSEGTKDAKGEAAKGEAAKADAGASAAKSVEKPASKPAPVRGAKRARTRPAAKKKVRR